jgi:hypothetical protein
LSWEMVCYVNIDERYRRFIDVDLVTA